MNKRAQRLIEIRKQTAASGKIADLIARHQSAPIVIQTMKEAAK